MCNIDISSPGTTLSLKEGSIEDLSEHLSQYMDMSGSEGKTATENVMPQDTIPELNIPATKFDLNRNRSPGELPWKYLSIAESSPDAILTNAIHLKTRLGHSSPFHFHQRLYPRDWIARYCDLMTSLKLCEMTIADGHIQVKQLDQRYATIAVLIFDELCSEILGALTDQSTHITLQGLLNWMLERSGHVRFGKLVDACKITFIVGHQFVDTEDKLGILVPPEQRQKLSLLAQGCANYKVDITDFDVTVDLFTDEMITALSQRIYDTNRDWAQWSSALYI